MKPLKEIIVDERIVLLKERDKEGVLNELIGVLSTADEITDPEAFSEAVWERERILSTGIGLGSAIPHVKIPSVSGLVTAVGVSREGIDFDAIDGQPVHVVVLIASPHNQPESYLRLLARFANVLKQDEVREKIIAAPHSDVVLEALIEADK